jgi:hypothetical protein
LGVHATNPVNRRKDPGLRGRLRAGRVRHRGDHGRAAHDQRDLDFALAFELPVREVVSTAGQTRSPQPSPRRRWNLHQLRHLERPDRQRGRSSSHHRQAGGRRRWRGRGDVPVTGLVAESAALLGLPDTDHPLRAMWGGAGAR